MFKGYSMIKEMTVLVFAAFALSACSANGSPSEDQVKQAIYEHYKAAAHDEELKKQLAQTSVKSCKPVDNGYVCTVYLKTRDSDTDMFFVFDKAVEKWKLEKLDRYRN